MMTSLAPATSAGDAARAGARGHQRVDRRLAAAVHRQREPLLQQIERHGLPHEPEADETDAIHASRSFRIRESRVPGPKRQYLRYTVFQSV